MAGTSEAPASAGELTDGRPEAGSVPRAGPASWVNAWTLTARVYEPLWRRHSVGLLTGGAFSTARELALLSTWLAPLANREVLDVGSSSGLYARALAAAGARVHALDASRAFLLEAGRRAAGEGHALSLVWGDAHALPFDDGAFDAVTLGATLNELTNPARALAEIGRVLRPGGRAWFMYVARAGAFGRPAQALLGLGGLRFPEPTELDAWAAAGGLVPIRAERRGPIVFALYGRGAGAPPVAMTAPGTGWSGPTPPRRRRTEGGTAPRAEPGRGAVTRPR